MLLLLSALLVSAQPAADQPLAAPAADDAPAPKTAKPKKVCKDDVLSGSRMAKRICLTEEEWAQRRTSMTDSARSGFSGKAEDH